MQTSTSDSSTISSTINSYQSYQITNAKLASDQLVLNTLSNEREESGTSVDLNFGNLYKSLSLTSQQIIDKLNELLKEKLPDGLQSLRPEDVTPETSADNVVKGVTALFSSFAKQNQDLTPEELVKKFIEQAKSGVEQGYGEAKNVLSDLGALNIEGVQDGIAKTKDLILEKLDKFAKLQLEELTGKTEVSINGKAQTSNFLLQNAGGSIIDIAA